MLSLFSSVGICRILRYGSSNTSTVEQQVCPRFFSGPSKFGEMRRCERKMLKCNAELVDIVFRLMFETFWVAPYDLRRDFPVLVNFERHARHASVLLGKIDFASASGAQIYELGKTVAALDRAVRQIAEARLFSPVECAEAQELVGRIRNALPAACAAGLAAALSHDSECCGMPAPPGPCDRRSQGFCHAPSPSLGITALRDFLGGSAKAGKTGAGLKRNGPRLGNEFPAGPDAF